MDWWIVNQLRAFLLSDLSSYVHEEDFTNAPDSLNISSQFDNHEHFTRELKWAYSAGNIGRKLFFAPPLGMTARQISACDVLMNMGLLTAAHTMHSMLSRLCDKAAKAGVSSGNANDVKENLEREHIPVFSDNISQALKQYFLYLDENEKAPFKSLLNDSVTETVSRNDIPMERPIDIATHCFDVALSFPGEVRPLVQEVSEEVQKRLGDNSCFYDNNYVSQLARPNLDVLLQDIYRNRSRIVVVFLSDDYVRKDWCGIEFRAIREIIFAREDKVMFVRTGAGDVAGTFKIDGYVDANRFNASDIAKFIQERVLLATMPLP